jgi:hypothetical protein
MRTDPAGSTPAGREIDPKEPGALQQVSVVVVMAIGRD